MGLSSSQTRLLSITSRMHDVELQAQNIMNQKVLLGTQQDDAYKDYCIAMDAKKIQVAFGKGSKTCYVDANFDNVCNFDPVRKCQYALTDAESGMMIVNHKVYSTYNSYQNDKYSFAWAMLGITDKSLGKSVDHYSNNVGPNSGVDGDADYQDDNGNKYLLMSGAEEAIYDSLVKSGDEELKKAYEACAGENGVLKNPEKTREEKIKALQEFREVLYSGTRGEALQKSMCEIGQIPVDDNFKEEFDYYVRLFEGIKQAGGCISLTDFSKDGISDSEWFYNVVSSGRALLNIYNEGSDKSKNCWKETSIATSTTENYLQEIDDDELEKKAEVKYQNELSVIKRKEAKYDQELEELENERTALKTEMDSIKKVKDDNIERTFGIYS